MKTLIFFLPLIFMLFPEPANGQPEHGRLILGVASTYNREIGNSDLMNLSFTNYKYSWAGEVTESDKMISFNVIPRAGIFITKSLAAGLDVYYSYFREIDGASQEKHSTSQINAVPFIRYYKFFLWSYPFAELNFGLGILKDKYIAGPTGSGGNNEYKYGLKSLGGGIGLAKPIGNRSTFEIMAGYNTNALKDKELESVSNYGAFLLKMGFTFFFMLEEKY